ncbi:hypothetical protein MRX96_005147 [Rhipicephalus microplus]
MMGARSAARAFTKRVIERCLLHPFASRSRLRFGVVRRVRASVRPSKDVPSKVRAQALSGGASLRQRARTRAPRVFACLHGGLLPRRARCLSGAVYTDPK